MGESAEPFSMRRAGVVETWVSRFDSVERAVEIGSFDADFADKVFGEMCGEGGGVGRSGDREKGVVDEDGYGGFAVHGGGWFWVRGLRCWSGKFVGVLV